MSRPRRYWLFKTDPDSFSFDDLKKAPKRTTFWNGVRNFQARNYLRDEIKKGDGVLFYHSVVAPPFVAGTAKVVREGYPDPDQFDSSSKYFDETADPKSPRWFMIDIQMDREFKKPVALEACRKMPLLENMVLLKKGSRLSVQPVAEEEWKVILKMGGVQS
jgi:predicted RNA-binding protein with PUA-like domain